MQRAAGSVPSSSGEHTTPVSTPPAATTAAPSPTMDQVLDMGTALSYVNSKEFTQDAVHAAATFQSSHEVVHDGLEGFDGSDNPLHQRASVESCAPHMMPNRAS